MTSPRSAVSDTVSGSMAEERTFVMIKPDGVRRGLVGEIVSRFERKGLRLEAMRMLTFDEELARRHYAEHVEKPFFPDLIPLYILP